MQEKRKHARYRALKPIQGRIHLYDIGEIDCRLLNVSQNGVCIELMSGASMQDVQRACSMHVAIAMFDVGYSLRTIWKISLRVLRVDRRDGNTVIAGDFVREPYFTMADLDQLVAEGVFSIEHLQHTAVS